MGSAKDGRNEYDPVEGPIISAVLLKRMAEVLELTQPVDISTLAKRVEAALMEYQALDKARPPKPKDIRKTFDNLERTHRQLMDSLIRLGRGERQFLDAAGKELKSVVRDWDWPSGADDAIAALDKIGGLIREAQRRLPEVKHGPQPGKVRWRLVQRLWIIYGQSKSRTLSDGTVRYPLAGRRHDAHNERDYGPFREFVVLAHEAFGFNDPERGVDGVIKSVLAKAAVARERRAGRSGKAKKRR